MPQLPDNERCHQHSDHDPNQLAWHTTNYANQHGQTRSLGVTAAQARTGETKSPIRAAMDADVQHGEPVRQQRSPSSNGCLDMSNIQNTR